MMIYQHIILGESIATRQVSGELIKVLSEKYPNLIGRFCQI